MEIEIKCKIIMIVLNHKDLQNLMLKNLDGQIAKCTNLYLNLWCKCRIKMKVGVQEEKKKYFQSYASRAKNKILLNLKYQKCRAIIESTYIMLADFSSTWVRKKFVGNSSQIPLQFFEFLPFTKILSMPGFLEMVSQI